MNLHVNDLIQENYNREIEIQKVKEKTIQLTTNRDALEKFVTLSQTDREKNEKLEQLRAIDNKMKIKIGLIDFLPLGVDTPEDLEAIRKILSE